MIKSFSSQNSTVRIVFATIAFGMGVDCKGLKTVVHYGPPDDIDDYFQESGRAGRDITGMCHAILLLYPRSLLSKHISLEMKAYCRNELSCRREMVLKKYVELPDLISSGQSNCCDICLKNYKGDNVQFLQSKHQVEDFLEKQDVTKKPSHCRLTTVCQDTIRKEMEKLRLSCKGNVTNVKGCDLSLRFPRNVTDEVISNFLLLTSADAVWKNISVLDWHICETIFQSIEKLRESDMIQFCENAFEIHDLQLNDLEYDVDKLGHLTSSDNSSDDSHDSKFCRLNVDVNYGLP